MPTNQQLIEFTKDHLCYEINHLCAAICFRAFHDTVPGNGFSVSKDNLWAESIVLHARNLYEFLYFDPPKKYSDDARAFDFFDTQSQWQKLRPAASQELTDLWRRAGKEIAHLTYSRLKLDELTKVWQLNVIANELMTALRAFAAKADKSKLHDDLAQTLEHWSKQITFEPTGVGIGKTTGATMSVNVDSLRAK